jgi:hypothetical protein
MKTYRFRFTVRPAEFRDGFVSVRYGLAKDSDIAREERECTMPDALAYLAELSARTPGPHEASVSLANRNDRSPPGFKAAKTAVYRELP